MIERELKTNYRNLYRCILRSMLCNI